MAAIRNISHALNRATDGGSVVLNWHKRVASTVAPVSPAGGELTSLWLAVGSPGAGATPTTAAVCVRTTSGGLAPPELAAGRQRWLLEHSGAWLLNSSLGSATVLYDRLAHIGGLSGTIASPTPQTVDLAPDRFTGADSLGTRIYAEIWTTIGTSATTITASYRAADGNDYTTGAVTFGGTNRREVGRLIELPLDPAGPGVDEVHDVTLAASTGTAGNFGITLGRPLATASASTQGVVSVRELTAPPGPQEVHGDACLAVFVTGGGAPLHRPWGQLYLLDV